MKKINELVPRRRRESYCP